MSAKPLLQAERMPPGLHRFSQMERVIHGRPVARVLREELDLIGARRVFVVTNRSLNGSAELRSVSDGLGDRMVGSFDGVRAHSPRESVIAGALAARLTKADLLLALGGGSVIDAAKAMLMCLRFGYDRPSQLDDQAGKRIPETGHAPPDAGAWLRVIAVPTTLSGAEFANSAGVSDTTRAIKEALVHPMMMPISVIMDPAMTRSVPMRLLLATGIKAVDHAVERVTSAAANPYSDAVSLLALRLLSDALPRIKHSPEDLDARAQAQYGMFMSLAGSASGVAVNVSHAIGHVLGAHSHVPHGETSCVMSPVVLRWNFDATAERQALICQALGARGNDAGSALARLVGDLELPGRLREVAVDRADFPAIAQKTMHEALLRNSRKAVTDAAQIEALLEQAW